MNNLTKQDKINAIVASVVGWDIDNLVEYVQEDLKIQLASATSNEIDEEYSHVIDSL